RDFPGGVLVDVEQLHVLNLVFSRCKGGAHRDQHGALRLKGEGLNAGRLSLCAAGGGARRAARGAASARTRTTRGAARGVALTGGGCLLGGGTPLRLGLGSH